MAKRSGSVRPQLPPIGETPLTDINSLIAQGLVAHQEGRLKEAEAFYAKALQSDPNHPDSLNLSGALAFSAGRIDDAIKLIGRAIRSFPGHMDAYLNLAEAYEAKGRRAEAISTCKRALVLAPDFAEAHGRLAWLQALNRSHALALAFARVALALQPDLVEALCARALALKLAGRFGEAEGVYRRALELDPTEPRVLTGLATLLGETDFLAGSVDLWRQASDLQPANVNQMVSLAAAQVTDGDLFGAIETLDRAASVGSETPVALFLRGLCFRDRGEFDQARAVFTKLTDGPLIYGPAFYALSGIKRLDDTPDRRKQLGRLVKDGSVPAEHRAQAGFALGDVLDRAGESDAAFAHYTDANRLHAAHRAANGVRFDGPALTANVALVDQRLATDFVKKAANWGNPSDLPVFVVGMPRSGTTLVEQICASHSRVTGLGELRALTRMSRVIAGSGQSGEDIGEWDAGIARAQADAHLVDLSRMAPGAQRAIDKTPLNLIRMGMMGALFPGARVIRCRRDLRDVVVSNHTMYFGLGNLFSTDQSDCAFAAREIERLGDIWQRQSRLQILEVVYEDLVADLDTHVRRIIDFLGLPWESECLNFHQTERRVDTPSNWQVRQPIYTSSVGRWRRFEKHLGPALATLAERD